MKPIVVALAAIVSLPGCGGGNGANAVQPAQDANRAQPGPTTTGTAQATAAPSPEPPLIGRCHMGHCSWFRVLARETIRQAGDERLVRLATAGGVSGPREDNDPRGGADQAPVTWEPGTSDAYFLCSARRPTVALQDENGRWEETMLDFVAGPYGATEAISAQYVAACHPGEDMTRPGFAGRHGYRARASGDAIASRPIARPEAMLDARD